jgi:hypothetical protein
MFCTYRYRMVFCNWSSKKIVTGILTTYSDIFLYKAPKSKSIRWSIVALFCKFFGYSWSFENAPVVDPYFSVRYLQIARLSTVLSQFENVILLLVVLRSKRIQCTTRFICLEITRLRWYNFRLVKYRVKKIIVYNL